MGACAAPAQGSGGEAPAPISATATIDIPTVSVPTRTPEATGTPDILNMPLEKVAQLLAEGTIEYPSGWEDVKKHDLAIAIAEYLNENVVADEAYIDIGGRQVGWDDTANIWRYQDEAPESVDLTGSTLPPLIISGYTNSEGLEVIIDPVTGNQEMLSKINLPELGEKSITELYAMGQSALRNYLMQIMLGTDSMPEQIASYIFSARDNHFPLPVVIYKNINEGDQIYHTSVLGGKKFRDIPTNSVLMPIFDKSSNKILFWVNVHQGTTMFTNSFTFSPEGNTTWKYTGQRSTTGSPIFGDDPNLSFGILFPGNTTEIAYEIHGSDSLLESGVGIGDAVDIRELLEANDIERLVQILKNLRLLVLYPDILIYPNS